MGIQANVGFDKYPQQGEYLGKKCEVCFRYDTSKTLRGTVVRDDGEAPFCTIIVLDDGRYVLATECMWTPLAS